MNIENSEFVSVGTLMRDNQVKREDQKTFLKRYKLKPAITLHVGRGYSNYITQADAAAVVADIQNAQARVPPKQVPRNEAHENMLAAIFHEVAQLRREVKTLTETWGG